MKFDIDKTKFKFCRIVGKIGDMERDYGWMLVIDSYERMNSYIEQVHNVSFKEARKAIDEKTDNHHWTNAIASTADHLHFLYTRMYKDVPLGRIDEQRADAIESVLPFKDIYDCLNELDRKTINGYWELIHKYGTLRFNYNGGYCPMLEEDRIVETYYSDTFEFPEMFLTKEDMSITKWKNGTHWYVRVRGKDVEYENKLKFDDYSLAFEAGMNYIESYNKQFEEN